jgi:hydroxymethylpyrimidine pyrophosphatase-like HAD family hydrolase
LYVLALATDYDGTLASHGVVDAATLEALERFKATGRRLILVTGRELPDLKRCFPQLGIFDRVVAENGALLYDPVSRQETVIAEPPPAAFVQRLRERNVAPLSVGRVIVATWEPHGATVLEVIRDLGLELQIIFNKGAVMVLPAGVNKATGLAAILHELELSAHSVVAVGDAENYQAFLHACGCCEGKRSHQAHRQGRCRGYRADGSDRARGCAHPAARPRTGVTSLPRGRE